VATASETLQSKDLGDISWIEYPLREGSQKMCCAILQWLLQLPDLQVPEDVAKPGERSIPNQYRRIHTLFGQIEIRRNYYYHATEHRGRFPLDEAIGLIDGYTPAVACLIGRCAAEQSFQQAEASFFAYTGLKVEARQFPRMAEYLGPLAERFLRADLCSQEPCPPRVYVATDGTGAPLRKRELQGRKGRQPDGSAKTHEIKVAAIFTQHPVADQKPWRDLDSTTYVATTERSQPFGEMVRAEFRRRFPCPPQEVVYLGDGAAWNWELQRVFFPRSIGIVDFYHAAEHVGEVVDLIEERHSPAGTKRRKRWVKLLFRGRLDTFLKEARAALPNPCSEQAEKALNYFQKNRQRMQYGEFRARGCFIGSGVVEAACKTVVAQRFKGSGMHWSQRGLSNILPLRTALRSGRFEEFCRAVTSLHNLPEAA
jgi:hypothetical protein